MKKNIFFIFYIVFFFSLTNNLYSKLETSIIVKIDRKIITNFDVKNKILSTLIIAGDEISQENINRYCHTKDKGTFLDMSYEKLLKYDYVPKELQNQISPDFIDQFCQNIFRQWATLMLYYLCVKSNS